MAKKKCCEYVQCGEASAYCVRCKILRIDEAWLMEAADAYIKEKGMLIPDAMGAAVGDAVSEMMRRMGGFTLLHGIDIAECRWGVTSL